MCLTTLYESIFCAISRQMPHSFSLLNAWVSDYSIEVTIPSQKIILPVQPIYTTSLNANKLENKIVSTPNSFRQLTNVCAHLQKGWARNCFLDYCTTQHVKIKSTSSNQKLMQNHINYESITATPWNLSCNWLSRWTRSVSFNLPSKCTYYCKSWKTLFSYIRPP